MAKHVIIDTDPGIDDALAILLALNSPELHISAITTVSGNVPVEMATRNLLRIMHLTSSAPRVSVAQGATAPLQKQPVYATGFHGEDGLGGLDSLRDSELLAATVGDADADGRVERQYQFELYRSLGLRKRRAVAGGEKSRTD